MRPGVFAVLVAAVLFVSCGRSQQPGARPPSATPAEIDFALRAEPSPPALRALFDRSCKNCHGVAGNGAPLVGQTSAWAPRIAARGPDGLLASVKAAATPCRRAASAPAATTTIGPSSPS